MSARFLPVVLVAVVAALACNEVPVLNLTSSYQVQVQELREHSKPAKLDILWVIDDSTSMCQEQQSLAASFDKFLAVFAKYTAIDMRLAVTTTNVCPKTDKDAVRGKFLYSPALDENLSPECVEKRRLPCQTDAQCQANASLPDAKNWVCKPEVSAAKNLYSCDKLDGSDNWNEPEDALFVVNSECRYACNKEVAPAACGRVFGTPDGCDGVCAGDTCSIETCTSDASLSKSFQDHAASCQNVCTSEWDCVKECTQYLGDADQCAKVCSASDCVNTCRNTVFPKQDFLCAVACDSKYSCQDRCVAEFGQTSYRCIYPGGDSSIAGCILPPATSPCPSPDCEARCHILMAGHDGNCKAICSGAAAASDCPCAKGDCGCMAENVGVCGCQAQCTDKTDVQRGIYNRCACFAGNETDEAAKAVLPDECSALAFPRLDNTISDRYFDAYKAGQWAGKAEWASLDDDTLRSVVFEQLFICTATVGTVQAICGTQEQGLLAGWMALDPNGERAAQARTFLRDDAYLLVVMVSDEEDCSTTTTISASTNCSCLLDSNGCRGDGTCTPSKCINANTKAFDPALCPLYPTSDFVNSFKSLKADPAMVVFASVAGDAIPDMPSVSPPGCKNSCKAELKGSTSQCADMCDSSDCTGMCRDKTYFNNSSACTDLCAKSPDCVSECVARFEGTDGLETKCADVCAESCVDRCRALFNSDKCDTICLDETYIQTIRKRFYQCKCEDKTSNAGKTYVCLSDQGKADLGARYLSVAAGFGPEFGQTSNICDGSGLEGALQGIAGTVVPLLTKVCLPRPIGQDEVILVDKVSGDGTRTPQTLITDDNKNGDFFLVTNAPECPKFDVTAGERPENAIQFKNALEYADKLEIRYGSKSFYSP